MAISLYHQLVIRISVHEFWEETNIQSIAVSSVKNTIKSKSSFDPLSITSPPGLVFLFSYKMTHWSTNGT